jgi:signal transduction histidine kinase
VIINLGTNAWHALDGKPGRITITQDQVSVVAADNPGLLPPARYARVVVTDDGHGMDKTILPRIFEPFFTTKPSSAGGRRGPPEALRTGRAQRRHPQGRPAVTSGPTPR